MTQRPKEVKGKVATTGTVKWRVCHSIMKQYFEAAGYFANCAANIESEFLKANLSDEIGRPQHRAYVVGAVVLATMAMETCINGIYLDARRKNRQELKGLDDHAMALLAKPWPKLDSRRRSILRKYKTALQSLGKDALDSDAQPYKDADNLVYLRNALTHYKPEWDDAKIHVEIRDRLKGRLYSR